VLAAVLAVLASLVLVQAPATGQGLDAKRAEAQRLRAAVAAESARIARTAEGVADAQARVVALDARASRRLSQTVETRDELVRARARLTRLERRAATATRMLSNNLVAAYKAGTPDMVTVILNSHGFADLLERVRFYKRISDNNAKILDFTRRTRAEVAAEARRLDDLRRHYSELAREALDARDQANVIRTALLRRQADQIQRRDGVTARLVSVRADIDRIERAQARAAAAARQAATATNEAPDVPAPSSGGSGGSDDVVARVVAAANQIASTPYVWGGGHGGWASGGYDCSGSISYALAAGGLLSSPLTSGGFMSWGEPGPGRRITVYANAGHAFMIVDGRRYDTSALSQGGTRWSSAGRSTAGFVARHPPGY